MTSWCNYHVIACNFAVKYGITCCHFCYKCFTWNLHNKLHAHYMLCLQMICTVTWFLHDFYTTNTWYLHAESSCITWKISCNYTLLWEITWDLHVFICFGARLAGRRNPPIKDWVLHTSTNTCSRAVTRSRQRPQSMYWRAPHPPL